MRNKTCVYVIYQKQSNAINTPLFATTCISIASVATTCIPDSFYQDSRKLEEISKKTVDNLVGHCDDFRFFDAVSKEVVEQIELGVAACDTFMFAPIEWCEKMTEGQRKYSAELAQRATEVQRREAEKS